MMTLSREFRFITHTHVCGSPHTYTGLPPHVSPSWVPVNGSEETHTGIADMAAEIGIAKPAVVRHKIRDGRAGATTRPRSSSATRWWSEILGRQVCRFLLPKIRHLTLGARVRYKRNETPRVPEHSRVALRCLRFR